MVSHLAFSNLLLTHCENAKHRELILCFLERYRILNNCLNAAIDSNSNWLTGFLNTFDDIARIRLEIADWLNIHIVHVYPPKVDKYIVAGGSQIWY